MTMITGDSINRYQAAVIAKAIELYLKTGMQVNRAYTPKAMLATASRITGRHYKRSQMACAANDLNRMVQP